MRRFDHLTGRTSLLLAFALTFTSMIAGCGDDDVVSSGGVTLQIGAASTVAGTNIICVPFTANGPANGSFSALLQFALAAAPGSFVTAAEITGATPGASGLVSNSTGTLNANGTFNGTFYWDVPADLGPFGGASGFLQLLAGSGGAASGNTAFSYAPVLPSVAPGAGSSTPGGVSGAAGGGSGRAAHDDISPAGTNVVLAGGRNSAGANNAFTSVDRFNVNLGTLQYTSSSFSMGAGRTDHASSFFLDPTTNALKLLVTGGAAHSAAATAAQNTANVYTFTPTEAVAFTANTMSVARRGHTATWAPRNKVYVIGGESSSGVGTNTIEAFDPVSNQFSTIGVTLASPRRGHTATLLPNGKILIAGGFNPAATMTALPAELFDTNTETMIAFTSTTLATVNMVDHTATRLANGWVLLAGGRQVTNPVSYLSFATVFLPETGACGDFTPTCASMASARALHSAVLLGDGTVLLTGGDTAPSTTTSGVELFLPALCAFSPVTALSTPRAEHSATAVANGTVVVVAGRNGASFLDSIETYPANNAVPVVTAASAFDQTTGNALINVTATDADGDGGYAILRVRLSGSSGPFALVEINQGDAGANGRLNAGLSSYLWRYTTQGFTVGQTVEIQIIPVGAVLGAPFTITTVLGAVI